VRRTPAAVACLLWAAALAAPAAADTITLTNGRVIEADRAWYEGEQLRYQKNGGVYGLPRSLVKSLVNSGPIDPAADPDIAKARERLVAQDPVEATRLLRLALARNPDSMPAHLALVEAYLALGDPHSARDMAQRALRLDDRDPHARSRLGDALAAMGDRAGAEAEYRRSLLLKPDAGVQRKLAEVAPAPAAAAQGAAQFRIRYDGGVNEPMGLAVVKVLGDAYDEYARRLGFRPQDPITVVLQMGGAGTDERVPEWAAGLNDGTIRVPVRGEDRPTARMRSILRHELAHSFLAARTGGNCPTWLQEGVSQWLEGGEPAREDGAAAHALEAGRLRPLLTLEAPFQALPAEDVPLAYAESLSAVAHILRLRGEPGIVRLLSALADRLPSEEALPVAVALSYPEFQASWEARLRNPGAAAAPRRP
jgi:tetratricopeptide (TPR) repeat protein